MNATQTAVQTEAQKLIIGEHHFDHIVSWGSCHFPAWQRDDNALIVDLRTYDGTTMCYQPAMLEKCGLPAEVIAAAAESEPQGFVLFDD